MGIAVDTAIPDSAFHPDEMPFMVEPWILALDDIRHVVRVINIVAMRALVDILA